MNVIDELATRAIESPIAPPPDRARIEALARKSRRRRSVRHTTAGACVTVLVIAGVLAIASPLDHDGVRVTTTTPTASSSTSVPRTTVPVEVTTVTQLVARLSVAHDVVSEGTGFGSPVSGVAHLFCVDGTRMHVYEYATQAERDAVSITADGHGVTNGKSTSHVDWIDSPHFFARGRIIVLVLGTSPLRTWLTDLLGPTISPEAPPGTKAETCAAPKSE